MRYRVERERTDHGYGDGWVILDEHGELVRWCIAWHLAMIGACHLAREATAVS